ncbi:MAG: hypothetical protein Q4B26_00335 [Eubacteriales bacterium]|nr:hypothetical protein [Eubacteriales bacterium]
MSKEIPESAKERISAIAQDIDSNQALREALVEGYKNYQNSRNKILGIVPSQILGTDQIRNPSNSVTIDPNNSHLHITTVSAASSMEICYAYASEENKSVLNEYIQTKYNDTSLSFENFISEGLDDYDYKGDMALKVSMADIIKDDDVYDKLKQEFEKEYKNLNGEDADVPNLDDYLKSNTYTSEGLKWMPGGSKQTEDVQKLWGDIVTPLTKAAASVEAENPNLNVDLSKTIEESTDAVSNPGLIDYSKTISKIPLFGNIYDGVKGVANLLLDKVNLMGVLSQLEEDFKNLIDAESFHSSVASQLNTAISNNTLSEGEQEFFSRVKEKIIEKDNNPSAENRILAQDLSSLSDKNKEMIKNATEEVLKETNYKTSLELYMGAVSGEYQARRRDISVSDAIKNNGNGAIQNLSIEDGVSENLKTVLDAPTNQDGDILISYRQVVNDKIQAMEAFSDGGNLSGMTVGEYFQRRLSLEEEIDKDGKEGFLAELEKSGIAEKEMSSITVQDVIDLKDVADAKAIDSALITPDTESVEMVRNSQLKELVASQEDLDLTVSEYLADMKETGLLNAPDELTDQIMETVSKMGYGDKKLSELELEDFKALSEIQVEEKTYRIAINETYLESVKKVEEDKKKIEKGDEGLVAKESNPSSLNRSSKASSSMLNKSLGDAGKPELPKFENPLEKNLTKDAVEKVPQIPEASIVGKAAGVVQKEVSRSLKKEKSKLMEQSLGSSLKESKAEKKEKTKESVLDKSISR